MGYLLDTHALWWDAFEPERLGTLAKDVLIRGEELYVSVASAWELGIKLGLGKLRLEERLDVFMQERLGQGFDLLPIKFSHLESLRALPFHHRDPFDRLLIAQARCEGLTLLSADRAFADYDVALVW